MAHPYQEEGQPRPLYDQIHPLSPRWDPDRWEQDTNLRIQRLHKVSLPILRAGLDEISEVGTEFLTDVTIQFAALCRYSAEDLLRISRDPAFSFGPEVLLLYRGRNQHESFWVRRDKEWVSHTPETTHIAEAFLHALTPEIGIGLLGRKKDITAIAKDMSSLGLAYITGPDQMAFSTVVPGVSACFYMSSLGRNVAIRTPIGAI